MDCIGIVPNFYGLKLHPWNTFAADLNPDKRDGPILIHFDGWGPEYDYWAAEDSPDLHPIGFMQEMSSSVAFKGGNSQLQKPLRKIIYESFHCQGKYSYQDDVFFLT